MRSASYTHGSSRKMKPGALLATNTSSIVLEQLAEKLSQPSRLVGLHFFNPVARMPLVEVIRSQFADPQCVQRGLAFSKQIDKLAVPCQSSPGFLVNRVLDAVSRRSGARGRRRDAAATDRSPQLRISVCRWGRSSSQTSSDSM